MKQKKKEKKTAGVVRNNRVYIFLQEYCVLVM